MMSGMGKRYAVEDMRSLDMGVGVAVFTGEGKDV